MFIDFFALSFGTANECRFWYLFVFFCVAVSFGTSVVRTHTVRWWVSEIGFYWWPPNCCQQKCGAKINLFLFSLRLARFRCSLIWYKCLQARGGELPDGMAWYFAPCQYRFIFIAHKIRWQISTPLNTLSETIQTCWRLLSIDTSKLSSDATSKTGKTMQIVLSLKVNAHFKSNDKKLSL